LFLDETKTDQMLAWLESEHFRYRRKAGAEKTADEISLEDGWSLELNAPTSPLITRMELDFRRFMRECMDFEFAPAGSAPRRCVFSLRGEGGPKDESFDLRVGPDLVEVVAPSERGLLHAAHCIERLCSLRAGPFLSNGNTQRRAAFAPRIAQSVFCGTPYRLDDPILLTDDYMSLMSHFGVNGIHVEFSIYDCARSSTLPELTPADWETNAGNLRKLCDRAAVHGIDIYPVVFSGNLAADAPVFSSHPDVRGALLDYPVLGHYSLCSSHPLVLKAYEELLTGLFTDVPKLGGAIFIVGGEGFVHCFTRPKQTPDGKTSCPRCADRNASQDVASLINGMASAIHSVRPDAAVFTWPYSAFTWSGDDFAQEEFIRHLAPDVELLSNFETPGWYCLGDTKAALIDYNIVNLGPSEQFAAQTRTLTEFGKRHYAKFESTVEPGWFFLPYLPVPYRWIERAKRLKMSDVAGYIQKWEFYGITGTYPEELLCEAGWGDVDESLLIRIAERDFGACPAGLLEGWKILSDVWERVPASHMMYGERQFYMKGPAYLGPAHPLIFDSQNRYDLSSKFFQVRGDAGETVDEELLREMGRNAPPRYSSDLLFVYPFGVELAERQFAKVVAEWDGGVDLIRKALSEHPTERGALEIGMCEIVGIHLRTIWNTIRFYSLRDSLFASRSDEESLNVSVERLTGVLSEEIENARRAIPVLERDPRVGYGHAYGQIYDVDMVENKLRQCRYVRDFELPELEALITFHVYCKYKPA